MLKKIKESANSFLSEIEKLLEVHSIDVSNYYLDHMCYRVDTKSRYSELLSIISNEGELLSESIVGGRPITTFKINCFASYLGQEISVVEIPSPKDSNLYVEGFEHVEFVIDCSLASFIKKYSEVNFDVKNIDKIINPEVRLRNSENSISIKFHTESLENIIAQEKKK